MKRLTIIKQIIGIGILGSAYLAFFRVFHFGIPCIFRLLTGYKCPGCGMTHALAAICEGDPVGALRYNALSLTVLPVVCVYLLYRLFRGGSEMTGRSLTKGKAAEKEFYLWEYVFLLALLIIVVAYAYIRNIT